MIADIRERAEPVLWCSNMFCACFIPQTGRLEDAPRFDPTSRLWYCLDCYKQTKYYRSLLIAADEYDLDERLAG